MFVGRQEDLALLEGLHHKKSASLVVLKGRRRIGKSTLIKEFAKGKTFYEFSGLPPKDNPSPALQRKAFSNQLQSYFHLPIRHDNWWEMLNFLSDKVQDEPCIILLDEISWMGQDDDSFLGDIKTLWDTKFKQNPNLILFICGSVSHWIEENIIANTGFVGRISLNMTLKPLALNACNAFWPEKLGLSAYEKFKYLAVTGCIPRYLEEWQYNQNAEENIKRLCFNQSGMLFNEFDQIFNDSLSTEIPVYKKIVTRLAKGSATREEITEYLKKSSGGSISKYLDNLISAGFLTRDFTWVVKDGCYGKLSTYRLSDNYIRFYLKYILPNKTKIEQSLLSQATLTDLPAWNSILGLQFENLVIANANLLFEMLDISPADIVVSNPYFQRSSSKQDSCQIDYLIQTRTNVLYLCEIKFSRRPITMKILKEMEAKRQKLSAPKGFSKLAVLIHINGVEDDVLDAGYFFKVIDFSTLLEH